MPTYIGGEMVTPFFFYVISPSGSIVHVYSDLNPNKHIDETLQAVKALKK